MLVLTQSIHSFYSSMAGARGQHYTDALLTNFGTKIFHQLGDAKSAEYASSLLGQRLDILTNGSPGETENWFDAPAFKTSFHEQFMSILQPSAFFTARTGGPANNFFVSAIVIKSEPFLSGERYAFVTFSQR